MSEENPKRAIPEAAAETRLLYAAMMRLEINEIMPRELISDICKKPWRECGGRVASARRMCLRQQVVMGTIRGVGIKRLADIGIVGEVDRDFQSIHRTAHRGLRKAGAIKSPQSLPDDHKNRYFAKASALGAIEQATRQTTVRRLELKVSKSDQRLSLEETIKSFT